MGTSAAALAAWNRSMKVKSLSLALLLLAGAASGALAQEQTYGRRGFDRPPQDAPRPPEPPQARPAESAPAARAPHDRRGDGDRRTWSQRGPSDRDRPNSERRDGDRRDWDRRDGDGRDRDRWDGGRRGDGDHAREGRRDDHRWRDGDRRRDWRHDGRGRGAVWAPRRYPPVYNSPSRYRGSVWIAPSGYYYRPWRYGETLPRGWYEREYWVSDWWSYGLAEPPYGYEWVRVGRDVVLIDIYSGRIVQVVRLVFW